jgi:hypothetical protein
MMTSTSITTISRERVHLSLTALLSGFSGAAESVQFVIADGERVFPVKTTLLLSRRLQAHFVKLVRLSGDAWHADFGGVSVGLRSSAPVPGNGRGGSAHGRTLLTEASGPVAAQVLEGPGDDSVVRSSSVFA